MSTPVSPAPANRTGVIIAVTVTAVVLIAAATFVLVRATSTGSTTTAGTSRTEADDRAVPTAAPAVGDATPALTAPPTSSVVTAPGPGTVLSRVATSTTSTTLLGNDLGPAHVAEIAAIDRFYQAVVTRDWDYARAHFINGEGNGPNKDNAWWSSQYGLINEYTLLPMREDAGTIRMGIVTHEVGADGGPYSHVICIPFVVTAGDFVRQAGKAPIFDTYPGEFIDPSRSVARLQAC